MRSRRALLAFLVLLILPSLYATEKKAITPEQAKNYAGELVTVCGNVSSAHWAARAKGQPTRINLGKPYPSQDFAVVIWGSDRAKFGNPEAKYKSKTLCVAGTVTIFRGVAEVIARVPSQITVK